MRSLQDISAFRIAAALWDKDATLKIPSHQVDVIDGIRENLLKLPLTESARDKLFEFLEPIGREIVLWRWVHLEWNPLLSNEYSSNDFIWTIDGTIDKAKTAKSIIEKKNEDIPACYQLACIYCLRNEIQKLWEQLEKSEKFRMMKNKLGLVLFWSHIVAKKNMKKLMLDHCPGYDTTPTAFAFREAVDTNNEVAIKYFFEKLNPEEIEEEMLNAVRDSSPMTDGYYTYYNDMWNGFCFLFPKLAIGQRSQVDAFSILNSFMNWPYITRFMDYARVMVSSLGNDEYNVILKIITYEYYKCNFLFEKFWNISPMALKQGINFYELEEKNLALIFKEKKNGKRWIISQVMSVIIEPFSEDYLELFKFVLSCCCFTEDDVIEIKETSLKVLRKKCGENMVAEATWNSYFNEQLCK